MKKQINLELTRPQESAMVFKALGSPIRLMMLHYLLETGDKSSNISEMARMFKLPVSTTALHVRILEEAGLLLTQEVPGRGGQKKCLITAEDVYIKLYKYSDDIKTRNSSFNMPLGNYFDCRISRPCGIATRENRIGVDDDTHVFYSSDRVRAQLLWFKSGFLEYRFPINSENHEDLVELTFSFETCSETAGYNNDWPSDITVWINNCEVFTFRSAGDFGGKRGIYTPDWWSDASTQYGELHLLDITREGCFGDKRKSSDLNLETLGITKGDYVSFKIGVKEDAEYVGGLNLFGENFGNYKQDIIMTVKLKL